MKRLVSIILSIIIIPVGLGLSSCSCEIDLFEGEVLNLYSVDPYTLDPALSGDSTSHQYIMQIFSGLVKFDSNLQINGDIASNWDVDGEGLVYTFYLRQDVLFHDGKQVTAKDFKTSWERACNPATGSQTAPLYLGDILGARDVMNGNATEIAGVKIVDAHTLEVTIEEPRNYFLYKLAYPTAFVVDEETTLEENWWLQTVNGTGPFKLREWKYGSRLELEKFDEYYGKTAELERIVYHLWAGDPMDLYETGQIDVADIGEAYFDKVTDEKNTLSSELIISGVPSLTFIGFNFRSVPFDDPDIRKAFLLAIDMDRVIELVYRDTAIVADGVIPPGIPGYDEAVEGFDFDPDAAKKLIAISSYGSVESLPPITLTAGGYGGLVSNDLQAIVYQWQENLGVNVVIRQIEPNEYFYNLADEKDELFYFGWVADYPHPQNFLEVLFSSGSPTNIGQYSNNEFDDLVTEAASESDWIASMQLYQQAEKILLDDSVLIPVCFSVDMTLVKPYVHGYIPNPLGAVALNEVSIEGK